MTSIRRHIHALKSFIEQSGACVSHASLPKSVHGRVQGDVIALRRDLGPRQELVALIHEMTHWLAHRWPSSRSPMECTVFEYEAEAVEALVLSRLGLKRQMSDPGAVTGDPTDNLLLDSVARVHFAAERICGALGLAAAGPGSEAQASVHFQAAACKKIVFEYEQYGMGDFLGLPEAL